LQFWSNFSFFAQGPNPASTFVNRNFLAEYVVCTLPFSVLLLSRIKDKTSVFLLTFSLAFNVVALMMTGTRSALIGLVILALLLPGLVYTNRLQFVSSGWRSLHLVAIVLLFVGSITLLGSIPTGNPKIIAESGRSNALDRAFNRTASIAMASEYSTGSFSIRATMWKATGRMILANPLTGVGAGAWEVQAPLYQEAGSQLETDYYAHNELLQLIAEYGLLGWLMLAALLCYLLWAAYKTWSDTRLEARQEAPLRALTLTSLLMFLLVSNAGFPWRLASTGALFALCLAILAASDLRLGLGQGRLWTVKSLTQRETKLALSATVLAAILAILIAQQALECENKLVRAVKIALTIQQSGAPNDPGWTRAKGEMLQLLDEGVAINPNYRKLTPITADAMAGWGDWKNATWVWESVLSSRPHVVALLINVARGHMQMGHFEQATQYMDRARKIQPDAASLKSLEVALWSRSGQEQRAARRAKELFDSGFVDRELVQVAYFLGIGQHQPQLAIQALETGIRHWPSLAVDSWLKLGAIYNSAEAKDPDKALKAYSAALAASTPQSRESVLDLIPAPYRAQVQ
jgi:O-antigen ligase